MNGPGDTAFEAFESKVLRWIERLEQLKKSELAYQKDQTYDDYKNSFGRLGCLATLVVRPMMRLQQNLSSRNYHKLTRDRERLTLRAKQFLSRPEIKSHICISLEGVKNQSVEIGRSITRALVPLSRSGAVSIPLEADLFATCALIIVEVGVLKFCAVGLS